MIRAAGLSLALVLAAGAARAVEAPAKLRRFALLIGANDGGRDRPTLRYATSDAESMARVLEELGGVAPSDAVLVLEPDRARLSAALSGLAARIDAGRATGQRLELVLYYSGHSDDEGLLLRGERFGYDELRRALDSMHADVRVAIVDSCSSGALTRRKGGVRRAPFLVDAATEVRGHAFLTSSSEHEAAQESDRIQASYFTHVLISGLRGAADATPDRRITLNEAYQYAFAETLRETEKTQAGAQHPAYDIQLQGTGDLVMTDLRATSASLALASELSGRFYVHDDVDRLVAEVFKPAGRPIELGLGPGRYDVRLDRRDELFEASVTLREGDHVTLAASQLERVSRELTAMRGTAAEPSAAGVAAAAPAGGAEGELEGDLAAGRARTAMLPPGSEVLRTADGRELPVVPFSATFLPHVSTAPVDVVKGVSVNFLAGRSLRVHGIELGFGINHVLDELRGAQMASGVNLVDGNLTGVQWAAGMNEAGGRALGMQMAAGWNLLGGGKATQLAGLFNVARADLWGVQIAGVFNRVGGPARGVQVGGVLNAADQGLTGVQLGGAANVDRGFFTGMQAAGAINYAPGVRGLQLSVINVGGDVTGAQIGILNIADQVHGVQLGVLNLANDSDVSIGPSIVRHGQLHLDAWTSSDEVLGAGFRFGSKHFYTLIFADSFRRDLGRSTDHDMFVGLGFGAHLTLDPVYVDVDLSSATSPRIWHTDTYVQLNRARLTVGYRVAPHLSVFGGLVANVFVGTGTDMPELPEESILPVAGREWHSGDVTVRMWPGLVLGVQI